MESVVSKSLNEIMIFYQGINKIESHELMDNWKKNSRQVADNWIGKDILIMIKR